MGISDDIKPKRTVHSGHHYSHSDHLFDDLDDFENEKPYTFHPEPAQSKKEEYKHKEDLEDDFFTGSEHKKPSKEHDFYQEEEPEGEKENPHRKHRKSSRFAKTLIWIMVVALLGLLVWQNRSEIKALVVEKVFNEKVTPSPIEEEKQDDYYAGESVAEPSEEATTTTPSTPTATATSTTNIDKTGIKIEILNGNGIANSGAKLKADLVAAGFTVSKTANAKNFNYATTLIYYKTGKEAEAELVKNSITGREITLENNDTLAGTYDVVIVLGAK